MANGTTSYDLGKVDQVVLIGVLSDHQCMTIVNRGSMAVTSANFLAPRASRGLRNNIEGEFSLGAAPLRRGEAE